MRQEEKITKGCFQITKRNVNLKFKFLDFYGHRLISSCQLNVFGIITVFDLIQDYFSCGMNILRDLYLRMETICALWEKYLVRLYMTDSFVSETSG